MSFLRRSNLRQYYRDYSLKEIVLNVYRKHSDTDSGVGEYRNDIVLRYGKGITGIRKTTDAEKLYTCIQPTGKDGLTINGLDKKEYDENGNIEYFTDGAIIRAPQARDRFPSNIVNKADAYILMRKEYDTDSKDKLYSMALSDLKTASEPVVTYEVDGYFDTNIGDTVRMQDQEWTPVLYLQARVSEQIRSLTNPKTAKTVFTNYKELTSEISDDLIKRMQDLISKNKVYTCSISTNNGIIFKNGIGSTTLTAYAYNNGVDVSGNLEIRWSKDGTEFYVGRSVTVNAEDVDTKAVYSFVATENGIRRGYYEVTITKVDDGAPGEPGKNGDDGKDGVGIESVTKYYLASEKSTGITVSSPGWTDTKQDMTETKKNLWSYDLIRYTNSTETKTTPVIIGVRGDNGETGDSGIIISPTAPEHPKVGQLWQTASGEPIKRWDGSKWVIYYISVENLNVEALSAIAANLGTVTAGLIKSLDGHFFIQVNTGEIYSEDENGINSSAISKGVFVANGMDSGRHTSLSIFPTQIAQYFDGATISNLVIFKRDGIFVKSSESYEINISKATNYDSGKIKGPFASINSSNYIQAELIRRGCVVTCKITALIQFPNTGSHGPFDELRIPIGYRPVVDIVETYSELVGPSVIGTGRYYISKDGGISIVTGKTDYCERIKTFTWITDD